MRRPRPGLIAIVSLLIALAAAPALAQDKPEDIEALREKLRADKKAVVAGVLDLSDAEAARFWPVYNAYQSDMVAHYDRLGKLIETYGAGYQAMTDEMASRLVTDYLALEKAHVGLLTSYLPRFRNVLPARKVARLYQVENKMRALVNYELARQIPLVK